MSADDQDRPRKTLTIKKTARDAHAEAAPKRVRTGARARLVAQNERAKDNVERQKDYSLCCCLLHLFNTAHRHQFFLLP